MTVNPHRGEVAITLRAPDTGAEREYVLRPSFQAAMEVEQFAGRASSPLRGMPSSMAPIACG